MKKFLKKNWLKLTLWVFLFALIFSVSNQTSLAYSSLNTGLPGENSSITIADVLYSVMQWLLSIIAILAIIAFAVSGIQYLMSGMNEKMVETAKSGMINAVIGLVVALSGLIVINTIGQLLGGGRGSWFGFYIGF